MKRIGLVCALLLGCQLILGSLGCRGESPPLFLVLVNDRYGYIDQTGTLVIEPQFTEAGPFSEGLAAVSPEGESLWGYVDISGAFVIEPQFTEAGPFSEGRAVTVKGDFEGYIDQTGENVIIPYIAYPEYATSLGVQRHMYTPFLEGLAAVEQKDSHLWGFIDKTGTWIIEPQFTNAQAYFSYDAPLLGFHEGLAAVAAPTFDEETGREVSKWGFIDKTGAWVIEPQFSYVRSFHEGLAAVLVNDNWGYIDQTGAWVITPKYGEVYDFSEGAACVAWELGGPLGYIRKTGEMYIEVQFYLADSYKDGLAAVWPQDKAEWSYIDQAGQVIWPTEASGPPADTFTVDINGSWVLSPAGDLVTLDFQIALRDTSENGNPITLVNLYIDDLETPAYSSGPVSLTEFPPPPGMVFRRDVTPGTHNVAVEVVTADDERHEKTWEIDCSVPGGGNEQFVYAVEFEHTQPGVQSEAYLDVEGQAGSQVEADLGGPGVVGAAHQTGVIGADGKLRLTWIINRFGDYSVSGTVDGSPLDAELLVR